MIHLTPQDIGKEFITREGKRVECVAYQYMYDGFVFSDEFARFENGRAFCVSENLDIISRITDEVIA